MTVCHFLGYLGKSALQFFNWIAFISLAVLIVQKRNISQMARDRANVTIAIIKAVAYLSSDGVIANAVHRDLTYIFNVTNSDMLISLKR